MSEAQLGFALGEQVGRRLVHQALRDLGLDWSSPEELVHLVLALVQTSGIEVIERAMLDVAMSRRFVEIMPLLVGVTRKGQLDAVPGLLPAWAKLRAASLFWECRSVRALGAPKVLSDGVSQHHHAEIALWLHSDDVRGRTPGMLPGEAADA